eukprot:TRINITY_DN11101_c0_g1_i1.p1 TRINITY_DN11101_c0_g1~~TRINITY_DN11101_c0_g1_i1.p1  ORF type:complete len:216 (-),score=42.91 TRINITY_DN11101_c0_g1_i1:27-674(-)
MSSDSNKPEQSAPAFEDPTEPDGELDEEGDDDDNWDGFHAALDELQRKWFKEATIANMYLISEIHDAAAKGKVDILKHCIEENHQDVDEQDQAQNTPLHWAASSGKDEAIKYLLEKGANINARNKLGDTALHRAVWRSHLSTVQILLDCPDVDVGILNHQGHMPIDLARDPVIGELVQSYEAPESPIEGHYIMEGYSDEDAPGAGTDEEGGSDTD